MSIHFSTHTPSVNQTSSSGLKAKFTAFKERVKSALRSLIPPSAEPVRPLKTRLVEKAPGPLQAPIKLLKAASDQKEMAELKQTLLGADALLEKALADVDHDIHGLHQKALNKQIERFDASTLKPVTTKSVDHVAAAKKEIAHVTQETQNNKLLGQVNILLGVGFQTPKLKPTETKVTDGLQHAKLQTGVDASALQPKPLGPAHAQVNELPEASLKDIEKQLHAVVEEKELQWLADQLAVRLEQFKAQPEGSPKYQELNQELHQLSANFGQVIGKIYKTLPKVQQDALAASEGGQLKRELWDLLRSKNPNLPAIQGLHNSAESGDILAKVMLRTAVKQLPTHLTGGDSPKLWMDDSEFTYVKPLGKGGFGVAELFQNKDGQFGVLKSKEHLANDFITDEDIAESSHEVKIHYAISNSNEPGSEHVLRLLGVAKTEHGLPVPITEYAPGGDVEGLLGKKGKVGAIDAALNDKLISPKTAELLKVQILQDSIKAVAYLQEKIGVHHDDIKPSNLFIGEDGLVKIADFGISKTSLAHKQTGVNGTPDYLSPEALMNAANNTGQLTAKADTWAIGIMAYQMFYGAHPFDPGDVSRLEFQGKMTKILTDYVENKDGKNGIATPIVPGMNVSGPVVGLTSKEKFVNSMLRPKPEDRPELTAALQNGIFKDIEGKEDDLHALIAALGRKPQDKARVLSLSKSLDAEI